MRSTSEPLYTSDDIPSAGIRKHHRAMMARASEALEDQNVLEREFRSLTFKMNSGCLGRMKAKIRDFVDELNAEMNSDESSRVYQLNLQFFEHTQR